MTPRIRHLNTATLCPHSAALVNGTGPWFGRARLVCHVLLIEGDDGLILVDTGLGLGDIAAPARLGPRWVRMIAPRLDPAETAAAQVEALGYAIRDVRHIVVTHLDLDHAGGIPDFPGATVHVHAREHAAAMVRTGAAGQRRYIPGHWQHGPRWKLYEDGTDAWFGFPGVQPLDVGAPVLLVPLRGHTAGHAAIAVRDGDRWLLHAGDGYFFHRQVETPPRAPLILRLFQRRADTMRAERIANQERLRALKAAHGDAIAMFCGHDPVDYDREAARSHA